MNKFWKVFIASLGAVNAVYSMLIPIAISYFIISYSDLTGWKVFIVILFGLLSTLYRGIDIGFLRD